MTINMAESLSTGDVTPTLYVTERWHIQFQVVTNISADPYDGVDGRIGW
jgi:hypothetical protein